MRVSEARVSLRARLGRMLLVGCLAGGFGYAIAQLFALRFAQGDIYPPYSTLRTDPLGSKAIFDALDDLPEVTATRNFRPLARLRPEHPITLVYAGVQRSDLWTESELAVFEQLVRTGSHAVFAYSPVTDIPKKEEEKNAARLEQTRREERQKGHGFRPDRKKSKNPDQDLGKPATEKLSKSEAPQGVPEKTPPKNSPAQEDQDALLSFQELSPKWEFSFDLARSEKTSKKPDTFAKNDPSAPGLEPQVPWHSLLVFTHLSTAWKVLYDYEGQPAIIERPFGRGRITLVADPYLLSNEAVRLRRAPQLLARLFSGPREIVFDEEHLGVRDDPGVASLVWKYHLGGAVAVLLLGALLFVWKNIARFVPAQPADHAFSATVAGRDAGSGFVNLLQRTIAPSALGGVCLAEWRRVFPGKSDAAEELGSLCVEESLRPSRARNPVALYQAMTAALQRRDSRRRHSRPA